MNLETSPALAISLISGNGGIFGAVYSEYKGGPRINSCQSQFYSSQVPMLTVFPPAAFRAQGKLDLSGHFRTNRLPSLFTIDRDFGVFQRKATSPSEVFAKKTEENN